MSNYYCEIVVKDEMVNDCMAGFPIRHGQFFEAEIGETEDGSMIVLDLGDKTDTDAIQEQFLNTSPAVIAYAVHSLDGVI
jgi:hypothetical protein